MPRLKVPLVLHLVAVNSKLLEVATLWLLAYGKRGCIN